MAKRIVLSRKRPSKRIGAEGGAPLVGNAVLLLLPSNRKAAQKVLKEPERSRRRAALIELVADRVQSEYMKVYRNRLGVRFYTNQSSRYDGVRKDFRKVAVVCLENGWSPSEYIGFVAKLVAGFKGFGVRFPPPRMLGAAHFINEFAVSTSRAEESAIKISSGIVHTLKCKRLPKLLRKQFGKSYSDDDLLRVESIATSMLWSPEFGARPPSSLRKEVAWAAEHIYSAMGYEGYRRL